MRATLEKQLQAAYSPWDRLPILIELTREPTRNAPHAAQQYAQEALALANEVKDPFWIACSLRAVGISLASTSRHSEVLSYLQKASRIFGELHDPGMKAQTDLPIANICLLTGRLTEAWELLAQSLVVFKEMKDPYWITHTLCSLGDLHTELGNHGKTIRYYHRAIRTARASHLHTELGTLYQHLSHAYRRLGNLERSKAYLFKSLRFHHRNDNRGGIATIIGSIANLYLDRKEFAGAEKYVRKSLSAYHHLGYIAQEALAWGKLGYIYAHNAAPEQALRCYRKGIRLARSCEDQQALAHLYRRLGELYVSRERFERGILYLEKGRDLLVRTGKEKGEYEIYLALAKACEKVGDTSGALRYYKEHDRLSEAYVNSVKCLEVSRIEARLTLRGLAARLKKGRSTYLSLNKMIAEKEEQLVFLTTQLVRREEKREKERLAAETPASQSDMATSENWEVFARQFHKVHHAFYPSLVNRFPDLTPTEMKVCSLIRIGLSSREIAAILAVSKRTVDNHRGRIHKKMALPAGTSLSGFIIRM